MVLPCHVDTILLQSFTNDDNVTIWDGFGTFHTHSDNPEDVALKVLHDILGTEFAGKLDKAAELHYEIRKLKKTVGETVQLTVSVFFAAMPSLPPMTVSQAWFKTDQIPYASMHPATAKWLPLILQKQNLLQEHGLLTASIVVEQPGDHTSGKVIEFTAKA